MATTLTYTGELVVTSCWCGIQLAVPSSLYREAQSAKNKAIFCPLGHEFVFGKNATDLARERADAAEATATRLRAQLDQARAATEHEKRRVTGYKGALAKTKKRAAAGVCPVAGCKRHFANVAAHVARQHPDFDPGAAT